jgi:hypothetical protein
MHRYPQDRVPRKDESAAAPGFRGLPFCFKLRPFDGRLYGLSRVPTLSDNYVRVKYSDLSTEILSAVLEQGVTC